VSSGGAVHSWVGEELLASRDWCLDAGSTLDRDIDALLAWAEGQADPVAALETSSVDLPGFDALAARALAVLSDAGPGAAWIRGLPTEVDAARLAYIAIGCRLGEPLENYGRLYDVVDQGSSYLDKPIPVSQTRYTTSFHTDSARRGTLPRYVALLCHQDGDGGDNQLASARHVHDRMKREAPELLERLYVEFVRDIVTPGTERTDAALLANRFPVYEARDEGAKLIFRYMRYWIEKGAANAGLELDPLDLEAMDLLDSIYDDPSVHAQLHLSPGDALFIDNRDIAHNRTPYEDLPGKSRHLVRLWITNDNA